MNKLRLDGDSLV